MVDTVFRPIDIPVNIEVVPGGGIRDRGQVTALNGGGYVVVWRENDTSANLSHNVMAQFFDASGVALAVPFMVNTSTPGMQFAPEATTLTNGDVIIAWNSDATGGSGPGMYFQRYNSSGVAQGVETFAASGGTYGYADGNILALSSGGFAVTWVDNSTVAGDDTATIFMQKYTNMGVVDGSVVLLHQDIHASSGGIPNAYFDSVELVELTSGNLALNFSTISEQQVGVYSSAGVEVLAPFNPQEGTAGGSGSYSGEVIALTNGNFMAIYTYSTGTTGTPYVGYSEIWGRIFDANGAAVGSEFSIVTGTENRRFSVSADQDGNGGLMVIYTEEGDVSGDGNNVFAQNMTETGTLMGEPQWLDYHTGGDFAGRADFAVLNDGNIISVYDAAYQTGGVDMRVISLGDDTGFTAGTDVVTLGVTGEHVIALGGDDTVFGGIGDDIIEGRTGLDILNGGGGSDNLFGDAGVDTLNGGDGDDFIWGGTEGDTISGGNGADHIDGGTGDDTINGDANDDVIYGGFGNDTIYGGEGHDTIYGYSHSARNYPDDQTADAGFHNTLDGGNGNDVIYGGNGTDTISGGEGNDLIFGDAGYLNNSPGDDDTIYTGNGVNTANGGAGIDTIIGGSGIDTLYGGLGNDIIHGHGGEDVIRGGADDDDIFGEAGKDYLQGDAGLDQLFGGAGNDRLVGGAGADELDGGDGIDRIEYTTSFVGVTVNLQLNSGIGGDAEGDTFVDIEQIYGSYHADSLSGDAGNNLIVGNGGEDTLSGGLGDDILYGGNDDDTIYGGHGDNTMYGAGGEDVIVGGDDVDTIYGGDDYDLVYAGDGNDIINGDGGDDILVGQDGHDTINGGDGVDTLNGGAGNDIINGGDGADIIYAGIDDDTIDGGADADFIIGDLGDDTIDGGSGEDTIYGGNGENTLNGGSENDDILGGADRDIIHGDGGADRIYGYATRDFLYGDAGNDLIVGGEGHDQLYGGDDSDTLNGGEGNDLLYGGEGTDLLYGGDGNDTLFGEDGNDTLFAGAGETAILIGMDGNDRLYGETTTGTIDFYGMAGDDEYYGSSIGVNEFHFSNVSGVQTDRVSFFKVGDIIKLAAYGFANEADSYSSFTQNGANVFFSAGDTTIIFYNANLAEVQAAVDHASAETPDPDKAVVSEDIEARDQDLIADFLDGVDTGDGYDTYVNAYGALDIYEDNERFDDGYGLTHIA